MLACLLACLLACVLACFLAWFLAYLLAISEIEAHRGVAIYMHIHLYIHVYIYMQESDKWTVHYVDHENFSTSGLGCVESST